MSDQPGSPPPPGLSFFEDPTEIQQAPSVPPEPTPSLPREQADPEAETRAIRVGRAEAPAPEPSPTPPRGPAPAAFPVAASSAPAATPVAPPATGQPPDMAAPVFSVVRRGGYDKAAVDAFLTRYEQERAARVSGVAAARQKIAQLNAELEEQRGRLSEQANPTYSGLGRQAAAMLHMAEEQASSLTADAQQAAEGSRQHTLLEAAALKADAEKEASDIRSVQLAEIDEHRSTVLAQVEQDRSIAESEAADILASAKREADQLRLASQQQANAQLTGAKRQAEQARAAADREAAEARRLLAVEKERMTKEAAEHHNSATGATARLVDEAEARAHAAEERARAANLTATKHREQAMGEGQRSLARSRREAEQIVSAARKQANQIVANATADAERRQTAARFEVDALQKRRDGIVSQLSQLRDLVASFATGGDIVAEHSGAVETQQVSRPHS